MEPARQPQHPEGSLKDLDAIPPCELRERFVENLQTLPETLRASLPHALRRTVPETVRQTVPETVSGMVSGMVSKTVSETIPTSVTVAVAGTVAGTEAGTEAARTDQVPPSLPIPAPTNGTGLRERFATFWQAYPRKVGKAAAWRAWQKHKPNVALLAQMLAALEWQCRQDDWRREGGRFIPHASTWILGGRWEDEPNTSLRLNDRTLAIGRAAQEFLKS
jgi:hypothetical protein